jgi:hypothetical protein
MARRADAVVVCSYYMRGHVADIFDIDERRIAVIPNGVDPSELQPVGDLEALRRGFATPREKLVLLVGRLVYEKGFQLALDALPGVIEQVGDVRFVVAGSGTHEQELKAQAQRLGLTEHGSFLGWIGDDALHSLYRIADLCVVPSIYEPFGLVALEAMASGCPCLVADTGGLREVVPTGERVGLRFNGGDAEHLGVMIERLLVDSELRDRLVTEASEYVLRFDWDDIAQRTRGNLSRARRAGAAQGRSQGGMSQVLDGLMQDDFPLTLHHMLARMRSVSPRKEVVTLTERRHHRARHVQPRSQRASIASPARSGGSAWSPAIASGRSRGTTSATSSCTSRSPAWGRCCTRSTSACSRSS